MNNSISKPVLCLIAACVALVIVALWFGPRANGQKQEPATSSAVEKQTATNPVSANEPTLERELTDGLPPVVPISLTNVLDEAEKKLAQTDTSVQALPQGTQIYGGIEFWLQGMIHLQGLATRDDEKRNFRTKIIVPFDQTNFANGTDWVTHRGSNVATVYMLAGARYSSPQPGEKFRKRFCVTTTAQCYGAMSYTICICATGGGFLTKSRTVAQRTHQGRVERAVSTF